jgi:hypothetical protein
VVESLWARVGGGLEEVRDGRRYGPADPSYPPPDGPWEPIWTTGRLVGWVPAGSGGRVPARLAVEEGDRIKRERRVHLLGRLSHKLRGAALALQESARQAAFGREQLLQDVYDQAQEVARRALAMEAVALDPKDPPRAVVVGAVLNLAAAGAQRVLPGDAVVRASEPVLVEALTRAYEWMGGPGCTVTGTRCGSWWRLEIEEGPEREPLMTPELGEPMIRHLVDAVLEGWLDASQPSRAVIYLPAG